MNLILLSLALAILPAEEFTGVLVDRVDLVEVNHYYDDQARHVFDQVLFYDWSPAAARFRVRDYRLFRSPHQRPQRSASTREYVTLWHEGDGTRHVTARAFRETWTQYDPEMRERQYLAKHRRQRLYTPRAETR